MWNIGIQAVLQSYIQSSSYILVSEAATGGVLWKKVFLEIWQNSQENTSARVSFCCWPRACNFINKETLAQVVSVEFCQISKNTFFTEHLREAASVVSWYLMNFDYFFFTTNSTIRYKHESVLLNSSGQVSENL